MNEDNPREWRNELQAELKNDITEITSAENEIVLKKTKSRKATVVLTYYR